MKERYVNPFTDFGFKKLFGEEMNKDLLIDFLNELLKEKELIKNLTFKKNEKLGSTEVDRKAIFDLYCENDKGEKFVVELQKTKQNFFKDRTVYYSTFPITEQAERGDWDFQLKSVYMIAILDFTFNDDDKDKTVVTQAQLMDTVKKTIFYDKLTFIYLQMPNFTKKEKELKTRFDKWLYIIKNLHTFTKRPAKLQEKIFKRLFKIAEIAQFTPKERDAYEESLKYYRDLKNSLETAHAEGIEKGIEKGMEKGMEKEKTTVTFKCFDQNMGNKTISKITGLSIKEIEELRIKWRKMKRQ